MKQNRENPRKWINVTQRCANQFLHVNMNRIHHLKLSIKIGLCVLLNVPKCCSMDHKLNKYNGVCVTICTVNIVFWAQARYS